MIFHPAKAVAAVNGRRRQRNLSRQKPPLSSIGAVVGLQEEEHRLLRLCRLLQLQGAGRRVEQLYNGYV
jgi:hypothetical protein